MSAGCPSSPTWVSRRRSNLPLGIRNRLPLLIVALGVGSSACNPDLTPVTAVTTLRILAASVDPPEVGPGESASFRVLVADPQGDDRSLDWFVTLCTPSSTGGCIEYDDITDQYADYAGSTCLDDLCTLACDQMCESSACSSQDYLTCCETCAFASCCVRGGTATPNDGILEIDGATFPPLTFSSHALDGLDAREAQEGVNAQLTVLVCVSGVCTQEVEAAGDDTGGQEAGTSDGTDSTDTLGLLLSPEALAYMLPPDQSAVAIKRARVSAADQADRNALPAYDGILVDGVLYHHGDTVSVPFGATVELVPVLSQGSVETYTYETAEGVVETRCEAPYHAWYGTDGTFETAYTEPDSTTACEEGGGAFIESGNRWTAPTTENAKDVEPALFVVVRDRRGGIDWLVLNVRLED